jgi:broad specificity phosphatase PhoE
VTTLYLIRHARSVGNAEQRVQGWLDLPLDDYGLTQATLLCERLRSKPLAAVYTSPLARAAATARPLAETRALPLLLDDRLREYHMGAWTGLTFAEIEAMMPPNWFNGGSDHVGPGGETGLAMRQRVDAFVQEVLARHPLPGQAVAVVSHGGTLGAMVSLVLGMAPHRRQPFTFSNASITELAYEYDCWRVRGLNDCSHLNPLAAATEGA